MALPDPHSLAMQTGHAPSQRWVARRKHVVSAIGRPPRNERTRVRALHFLGQRAGLKGGSWDDPFLHFFSGCNGGSHFVVVFVSFFLSGDVDFVRVIFGMFFKYDFFSGTVIL